MRFVMVPLLLILVASAAAADKVPTFSKDTPDADKKHAANYGKELTFTVTGNDEDAGDNASVDFLSDPGLPNGASVTKPSANKAIFKYTPLAMHRGNIFKVCAKITVGNKYWKNNKEADAVPVRCWTIEVARPEVKFEGAAPCNPAGDTNARVGCKSEITVCVKGLNGAETEVTKNEYVLHPRHSNKQIKTAGLPVGASFPAANKGQNQIKLQFTPQHGHEGYKVAIALRVTDASAYPEQSATSRSNENTPFAPSTALKTFSFNVARCVYCPTTGDTLRRIAERYNADWLALWTANPDVENPDHIVDQSKAVKPIFLGALYTVKKHDTLARITKKFNVDKNAIKRANADVDIADKNPVIGLNEQLCIIASVCHYKCDDPVRCSYAVTSGGSLKRYDSIENK